MKDNISDMLTRIRNGQKANLLEIQLFWPTPKVCEQILILLQREGFIRGFQKSMVQDKKCYIVFLKYTVFQKPVIQKISRISTPGKRMFSKVKHFWKVHSGLGIFIISSSKGLITDNEARFSNIGGEILFYIE